VAIKTIGNIMLVTYLLQFMFAVIGVQLFKVMAGRNAFPQFYLFLLNKFDPINLSTTLTDLPEGRWLAG